MDEFLSFVTIDVWTMIMTWGNLLILFLLMKKFLFVPVKKVIDARQKEIEKNISDAENLKKDALNMKDEYAEKLAQAKKEADNIIKSATKTAQLREEEIIKDANNKASDIIKKADKQIENSKKEALNELKEEVSAIATSIAEKIIEKDINEKDPERLIEEFIDNMGGL